LGQPFVSAGICKVFSAGCLGLGSCLVSTIAAGCGDFSIWIKRRVLFGVAKFWGIIWIFLLACNPIEGCVEWVFLVIWDATRFTALVAAFLVHEKPDTIPTVEINAPAKFMAFIWWK
jgi:hypothetical protein